MNKKIFALFFVLALVLGGFPLMVSADGHADGSGDIMITNVMFVEDNGTVYNEMFDAYAPQYYDVEVYVDFVEANVTDIDVTLVVLDFWSDEVIFDGTETITPLRANDMVTFADVNLTLEGWYYGWVNATDADTGEVYYNETLGNTSFLGYQFFFVTGTDGYVQEDEETPVIDPVEGVVGDLVNMEFLTWNSGTTDSVFFLNLSIGGMPYMTWNSTILMGENYTFAPAVDTTDWAPGTYTVEWELFADEMWDSPIDSNVEDYWFNLSITEGMVHGWVWDDEAEAVDDAVVTIWREYTEMVNESGNMTNVTMVEYYNTTTNETGYYMAEMLPLDTYMIEVTKAGYTNEGMDTFTLDEAEYMVVKNLTLNNIVDGFVHGWVTHADNASVAIAGADVIIWHQWVNETNVTMMEYYNTTTNETGYYSSGAIPLGDYMVMVMMDGYEDSAVDTFTLTALDNEAMVDFSLAPITEGYIHGYVTDNASMGIENVTVVIWWEWVEMVNVSGNMTNVTMYEYFNATTNASGYYMSEMLVFGDYKVMAMMDGYTESDTVDFTLTALANVVREDFVLEAITEGYIHGWITDAANASVFLEGAEVEIWHGMLEANSTNMTYTLYETVTANATGYYMSSALPLGEYKAVAKMTQYEDSAEFAFTLTAAANMVEKDFALTYVVPTFMINLTVTPADAIVMVDGVAVTLTDGFYHIEVETGEDVTVKVTKAGYETYEETKNFTADGNWPVALTQIFETHTVQIKAGDMGVEGVEVIMTYMGVNYTETTDANGNVTFTGLPYDFDVSQATFKATKEGYDDLEWTGATVPEFVEEKKSGSGDDGISAGVIIGIVILLIIIVVVLIFVFGRGKKEPEIPPELEDELEDEEEGDEEEDEFMEEGGTLESDEEDIEDGPESIDDFEADEPEDELEGVEETADEMEDFEDDFDEDFDEELDDDLDEDFDDDLDEDF